MKNTQTAPTAAHAPGQSADDQHAGSLDTSSSSERENRWRLEEILLVCEHQLQLVTQKVWDSRGLHFDAKSLPPFQRPLLTGPIETWDVSMCNAVLKQLNGLKKKSDAAAVGAIVNARNLCAHAAGGRVTTANFELHANACMRAFTALGGDAATLQKLRTCEIDASDVGILSCSREATKAAEREKRAGNRYFRESNFVGARECYTRGLQIPGAVEPEVRSHLHNNRATANIHLKDFAQAKEDAKHASELAPQWAKPHLRLAEIYYETYKYHKAVARLEIAHGYATAAQDTAVLKEVTAKLAEYRLERDKAARRESENLAHGPMFEMQGAATRAAAQARLGLNETQDPMALFNNLAELNMHGSGMDSKKHVVLAQMAQQDGRLADAARDFMAAAVAGDPEGMYNYAVCQLYGRGTRKNIADAVRWLEKAASMPITESPEGKSKNIGIGEAMSSLGELYNTGVHYAQDKSQARKYWERSAELNVSSGLNNFGICLKSGSHGVKKDLPRARELFRRSAELLFNPAMSNLASLHASLLEFETAARWEDAAFKFGFLPAANKAEEYRQLAKTLAPLPQPAQDALTASLTNTYEDPEFARKNQAPTLDTLRAIGSPYGDRLFAAKQLIADAMQAFYSSLQSSNPTRMADAVNLAVQALRIDGSELVLSEEESGFSAALARSLQESRVPLDADLAQLLRPSDASSTIAFWKSLQLRFPNDLTITKKAACVHMFTAYAGHDIKRGLELFQRAFSLLPRPNDDSDPHTLDLLYCAGVAYFQTKNLQRAKTLLTRFLKYAPADGHRKGAEAHYILGKIAMAKVAANKGDPDVETSLMARHLREGDLLLQQIPAFLRGGAQSSPNRNVLQRAMRTFGSVVDLTRGGSDLSSRRRGGELVDGPRRHQELRCDSPTLQPKWREEIGSMAAASHQLSHGLIWSTTPARKSTGTNSGKTFMTATIDELFSGLADRVYTSRALKCIVVSLPSFNGSSFQFVVEDSQREPAKIAVYNAPQSLISQLVPGRAFKLLNPYVRIAHDSSIMLRVDNPSDTIQVEGAHAICWVCSVEEEARERFKRCAKCHKALYCSKTCQTHDWTVDGHRFLCKTLRHL